MYGTLWAYGCRFCVDRIDPKRATFDCANITNFVQDSQVSASDTNLLSSQLDYCGMIHDIIEVGFRCCAIFILVIKWFRTIYNVQTPQ